MCDEKQELTGEIEFVTLVEWRSLNLGTIFSVTQHEDERNILVPLIIVIGFSKEQNLWSNFQSICR